MIGKKNIAIFILALLVFSIPKLSYSAKLEVQYAGFATTGSYADRDTFAPYTSKILKIIDEGRGIDVISLSLLETIKEINPNHFKIVIGGDGSDFKKSADQIVMSIGLDYEDFSYDYDEGNEIYLNTIDLYFQIIFFNFNDSSKTYTLLASIPYRAELTSLSNSKLTNDQVLELIKDFYTTGLSSISGEGTVNAFSTARSLLKDFKLKIKYHNRIGVTKVLIEEKAIKYIPKKFTKNPAILKNIISHTFSSSLSMLNNVSVVPFSEGANLGKMRAVFVDSGKVYDITLPRPDYNIEIRLRGFKRVVSRKGDVFSIHVFGAFTAIKIFQPDVGKIYIESKIKNGFPDKIPNNIKELAEWPRFFFSLRQQFMRFNNTDNMDKDWLKSNTKITNEQFANYREVLSECK